MNNSIAKNIPSDLLAGLVVFLVALPLCLGIALASNTPLYSGILAGVVGGIIVGALSSSQTSVSGPAAGLTVVIIAQLELLGSFEALLSAVVIAGIIQIIFSLCRLGFIAAFFPSSVIKGLLFAIGVILVLKQIPHILGHDEDPIGNKSFIQLDNKNTFSEIIHTLLSIHFGAGFIGLISIIGLVFWDKLAILKKSQIPAPIAIIGLSIVLNSFFRQLGSDWVLSGENLVQVPIAGSIKDSFDFLIFPDFSSLSSSNVYIASTTIALVASLETLLNLEAIDKIDPLKRKSPPNKELFAQGVGNIVSGLIGGLPITSVIVRSSVNINAGVKTKLSAIFHGFLILGSVLLIPNWLNQIPLAALGAILFVTGLKLASPKIFMQMWHEGKNQFLPFILTVVSIVLTDLLTGVLIGLGISICFILYSNIQHPLKKRMEKYMGGDEVLHIELANQVSCFNRASLEATLKSIPQNKHVLIDARNTDYIDPDILNLIQTLVNDKKGCLSLIGFEDKYPQLHDHIEYVDFTSRETQKNLSPNEVLKVFQEGNQRFREGVHLTRDIHRQLHAASTGQFPIATVLSCIDSRSPVELIFDLSIGDIFSVRIAGNVVSHKILGSIEYACAVAGAKLVLVMGHTSCGAIKASAELIHDNKTAKEATGCDNLDSLVSEIQKSIDPRDCKDLKILSDSQKEEYFNNLSYKNVLRTIEEMRHKSSTLDSLLRQGKIAIMGAIYNIKTGEVRFFNASSKNKNLLNKLVETTFVRRFAKSKE